MSNKQKQSYHFILLGLIFFVAAILRLYRFWEIPFMFDEFSAIFRTYYDNFSDLIEFGVKKKDMHPAGIQVFLYYWTDWFGYNEWILKLPFVLMGIASVWLAYEIGRLWFGATTGLLTAATMAVLQYTIMYSQLIRMYSSGLFFSLLMVYFWTEFILNRRKNDWPWLSGWILATLLASYNHAFSLFFAAIVGATGLFVLPKNSLKNYLIAAGIIILLYLPHLPILLYHLQIGGVGGPAGWLSAPDSSFFLLYLRYIFNYSWVFLILFLTIFITGVFVNRRISKSIMRFRLIALIWFLVPLLTGYFYSIYRNPVLQFSVLLFSFPFLLLFAYSFVRIKKAWLLSSLVVIILATGSLSLIYSRDHYKVFYKQGFDQIPLLIHESEQENPDTETYLHVAHPGMIKFYFEKYDMPVDDYHFLEDISQAEFRQKIKDSDAERMIYAWTDNTHLEYIDIIYEFYPHLLIKEAYFNGEFYLFSKLPHDTSAMAHNQIIYQSVNDFEGTNNEWNINEGNILQANGIDQQGQMYSIGPKDEYAAGFSVDLSSLITHPQNILQLKVDVFSPDSIADALMVISITEAGKEKPLHWSSAPFRKSLTAPNQWQSIYRTLRISHLKLPKENAVLKTYIWNPGKDSILIDNYSLSLYQGNRNIYGIYEELVD